MATRRGMRVSAPADGRLAFVGPFRGHDGVVVIDHGDGWTSMLTGIVSSLPRGGRVAIGAPLGRATGPVTLELWHEGRPLSPALIAGSSRPLSNEAKAG
nr:peptidoglycan DD-metalloendopeptidase family protein [Sphingomicrobium nitratireducens]